MKRSLRGEGIGRICLSVAETTMERALRAIQEAHRAADLIELRVDYLRKPFLARLMTGRRKPFIVTNRPKGEGGRYGGDERRRLGILKEAVNLGAEYIDVEIGTGKQRFQHLIANKRETQIILSFHDFQGTPSPKELRRLFDRMIQWRPDLVKIVTFAQSWEDNFHILSLISYANKKKERIVAFCMGEKGKISRVFAPSMGAAWTYASLSKERASAPGQLTVREIVEIWERLR